jgi:hypothetical protein
MTLGPFHGESGSQEPNPLGFLCGSVASAGQCTPYWAWRGEMGLQWVRPVAGYSGLGRSTAREIDPRQSGLRE